MMFIFNKMYYATHNALQTNGSTDLNFTMLQGNIGYSHIHIFSVHMPCSEIVVATLLESNVCSKLHENRSILKSQFRDMGLFLT